MPKQKIHYLFEELDFHKCEKVIIVPYEVTVKYNAYELIFYFHYYSNNDRKQLFLEIVYNKATNSVDNVVKQVQTVKNTSQLKSIMYKLINKYLIDNF